MPRIKVGVNMPWGVHGKDFGTRIAGAKPAWRTTLPPHLAHLKSLRIFAVRWFILADGEYYGRAPELDPITREWIIPTSSPLLSDGKLTKDFEDDFDELLTQFATSGLLLIPSLINHQFCFQANPANFGPGKTEEDPDPRNKNSPPKGYRVKCGRYQILNEPVLRADFLKNVLEKLVTMSKTKEVITGKKIIHSWELINEPEMCTLGPSKPLTPTEPERKVLWEEMRSFIREGCTIINTAGFRSTVGFQNYYSPRDDTEKGWNDSGLGVTLHQFHYYVDPGPKWLPKHDWNSNFYCFVGEIATVKDKPWGVIWGPSTITERLWKLEKLGYPEVFLWAAKNVNDGRSDWNSNIEAEINNYLTNTSKP